MKTLRLFFTALFAFLLFSCRGLNMENNRGSIFLRLPSKESSVRGFEAHTEQKLAYTITLLDQNEKEIDKKDGISETTVTFEEIDEGSYILRCECFIDINGEKKLYAQAKDNAEVKAGLTSSVTLYLERVPEFIPEYPLPEETETPETGGKEEEKVPGGNTPTDPKQEETLSLPANYNDFDLASAINCSDWTELKNAIEGVPFNGTQVLLLSGDYTADSMIYMSNSRKIFIMATTTTKITVSREDCFTIVKDELIVYGTEKAPITFTGEAAGSIFDISGSTANLTVTGNVNFENFKNSYATAGGTIYMIDGRCTIASGVTFTNCEATKSDGGAIYVLGGSLVISGDDETFPIIFNSCKAAGNGGAIYIEQTRESELATLLNIQFGSESGKENSCVGNGPDICINSNEPYSEALSIDGYIGSASDRIDIYAANTFVFSSYIETTSKIYITFSDEAFKKAGSEPLLDTNLTPYEENLRSLIYVRAESDGDMWKNITEDGMVIH